MMIIHYRLRCMIINTLARKQHKSICNSYLIFYRILSISLSLLIFFCWKTSKVISIFSPTVWCHNPGEATYIMASICWAPCFNPSNVILWPVRVTLAESCKFKLAYITPHPTRLINLQIFSCNPFHAINQPTKIFPRLVCDEFIFWFKTIFPLCK